MINAMYLVANSTSCFFLLLFVSLSSALPFIRLERSIRYPESGSSRLRMARSTGLSEQIIAALPIAKGHQSKKAPSFFVMGALPGRSDIVIDDNMDDLFA